MPYTAPLKSSLSAQHIEYCDSVPHPLPEWPGVVRSSPERLRHSRSYSSTSYVRRHRRSPSICKPVGQPASEPVSPLSPTIDPYASLRQSPPPVSNAAIPLGAVISPPDSAPNSDEESPDQSDKAIRLEELEAAVRSIEQRREASPERMGPAERTGTDAEPSSSVSLPAAESKPNQLQLPLSKEARKVSHSRSATESAVALKREEALTSSPDESDAELTPRPPMVRKKSGELVRPALRTPSARRRPSSMPGTPVYSKAVHFDSQLEHIRHFLQLDRPLAVSAETSPVDNYDAESEFPFGHDEQWRTPAWEWEIRLPNFPKDLSARATRPVRLERLFLSSDKNILIGTVAVANLAFNKQVAARFTFDNWRTVSEVGASYCHDVRRKQAHDGCDRFSFDIKLDDQAHLEHKTMFICMRYSVNGQEHWDNNDTMNYQVDFLKSPKPSPARASNGPRPSLPRSRSFTGSHTARPRSMPHSFDDLPEANKKTLFSNPFTAGGGAPLFLAPSDDIDTVVPPTRRENPHRQVFGSRYDFGASLSAAMQTKPPLDRTTLAARARSGKVLETDASKVAEKDPGTVVASPVSDDIRDGARAGDLKPSSLVSSKPQLESSVYKELVDKYCFVSVFTPMLMASLTDLQYGSPTGSNQQRGKSATSDWEAPKPSSAPRSTSPPLSTPSIAPRDAVATEAPRDSRPTSLSPAPTSPRTSPHASPSAKAFRYYHQSMQNNFLNDSQSSTVIRG